MLRADQIQDDLCNIPAPPGWGVAGVSLMVNPRRARVSVVYVPPHIVAVRQWELQEEPEETLPAEVQVWLGRLRSYVYLLGWEMSLERGIAVRT